VSANERDRRPPLHVSCRVSTMSANYVSTGICDAENARKMARDFSLTDPRHCWFVKSMIWEWLDKAPALTAKESGGRENLAIYSTIMKNGIFNTFFAQPNPYAVVKDVPARALELDVEIKKSHAATTDATGFNKYYGAACSIMSIVLKTMLKTSISESSNDSKRCKIEEILFKSENVSPIEILIYIMNAMPNPELWMGAGITAFEASPGGMWPYRWTLLRQHMEDTIEKWLKGIPTICGGLDHGQFLWRKIVFTPFYGVIDTLKNSEKATREQDLRIVYGELHNFTRPRNYIPGGRGERVEEHATIEIIKAKFQELVDRYDYRFQLSDERIHRAKSRPRSLVAEIQHTPQAKPKHKPEVRKEGQKRKIERGDPQNMKKNRLDKSEMKCHLCGEKGHFKAQCPSHNSTKSKDKDEIMQA